MSTTRQRKSPPSGSGSSSAPTTTNFPGASVLSPENNASHLPPPREKRKFTNPVITPPLMNVRLTTIIYSLAAGAALMLLYYAYMITVWKAEAGGWWNLAMGRRPPSMQDGNGNGKGAKGEKVHPFRSGKGKDHSGDQYVAEGSPVGSADDVEYRINDLASVLGIKPTDLASAISDAVSLHVAPATLSSISASASAAQGDKTAVAVLVGDEENTPGSAADVAGDVASGFLSTMEKVVGLDEPAGGLD